MADRYVIVDVVANITPAVERPTTKAFEVHPEGFTIEFRSGETALLKPDERAPALLDILDDLRDQAAPVYVETAGKGETITQLLIPAIVKVVEIREGPDGDVDVVLFPSHARHRLVRKSEAFDRLLAALSEGHESDAWQLVSESDDHEILDVRPFVPDKAAGLPSKPGLIARLKSLLVDTWLYRLYRFGTHRICAWLCCPRRFLCCYSMAKAWEMFNLCASKSCDPVNPQPPCIPFLYPDDGCWARAHEMCRLMVEAGVKPAKVWIDGGLTAATKNHPNCAVNWGWHVAPTLCLRTYLCSKTTYVIDPSLFTGPVRVATWKSAQGDPNAALTHTAWTVYWRNWMPTDPNFVDTNQRLTFYRNQLKLRSTTAVNPATGQLWGPPPYAHC